MGIKEEGQKAITQSTIDQKIEEKNEENAPARKNANEHGIAGFVIGCVILFKSEWNAEALGINGRMFNDINASENYIGFVIAVLVLVIAIGVSIKGLTKKREYYQKGLAITGFIINVFLLLGLTGMFFDNYT